MTATRRHLRDTDRLDDDTIVIRGAQLDPATLRADAERYHAIYGEYGISVFATRDATVDELAQLVPLVRFQALTLVRAGVPLRRIPTRADRHKPSTLHGRVRDIDRGIDALVSCEHLNWINPYHEP